MSRRRGIRRHPRLRYSTEFVRIVIILLSGKNTSCNNDRVASRHSTIPRPCNPEIIYRGSSDGTAPYRWRRIRYWASVGNASGSSFLGEGYTDEPRMDGAAGPSDRSHGVDNSDRTSGGHALYCGQWTVDSHQRISANTLRNRSSVFNLASRPCIIRCG